MIVTKSEDEKHTRPRLFSLVLLAENTLGKPVPIRTAMLVMRDDQSPGDIIKKGARELVQPHIPDVFLDLVVDAFGSSDTVALGGGTISLETGQILNIIWWEIEELLKSVIPPLTPRIREDLLITRFWLKLHPLDVHIPDEVTETDQQEGGGP